MDTSLGLPQRTSKDPTFRCNCCGKNHTKQAFISHASKDKGIVEKIRKACCASKVAPYLYECSPEYSGPIPPSDIIADAIENSELILVVPGESVSEAYWTQAWIGFEIGVRVGINIATRMKYTLTPDYFEKRIIVLQDICQGIKVTIPRLRAISLFDFDSADSWKAASDAIRFWAEIPQLDEIFRLGNKNQQAQMKADVKCKNPKCKSQYEAWITIEDARKLGKGFNCIDDPKDLRFKAECTIECPSCDQMVTRVFTQALGVKRSPHTLTTFLHRFRFLRRIFSRRK